MCHQNKATYTGEKVILNMVHDQVLLRLIHWLSLI